jgi:hypothetical protein
MVICGCGLPACCCQPAVAGGFFYADLWGELSTHLALQALFTQSSPVHELLLQALPFLSTLGEVTLHPLSQACMFIYSSRGKWVFPPSPVEFSSHCRFYKLSRSLLLGVCCCSCWLACLFIANVGSGSSPLSCGVFLPPPLSPAFPLLVAEHTSPLPPSLARPGLFIYTSRKDSPPPLRCSGCPTLFATCLYCSYCLLLSFSFFPR